MFRINFKHLEFQAGFTSLRPWTFLKLFKRTYGWHFVFGRLSVSYTNYLLSEFEIHTDCGGHVRGIGEDGISYCEACETIVEGATEYISEYEYEQRYG